MRLGVVWATVRTVFGVEPPHDPHLPGARTSSPEERRQIVERLTRQQAALADLLASASLDEQRSRSQYPDV